jgi:hypothetical protein
MKIHTEIRYFPLLAAVMVTVAHAQQPPDVVARTPCFTARPARKTPQPVTRR